LTSFYREINNHPQLLTQNTYCYFCYLSNTAGCSVNLRRKHKIWLDELLRRVNTVNPGKKFIFPRYAYVGWISGYIIDKTSKQYTEVAVK
jgi:hypothetical protein